MVGSRRGKKRKAENSQTNEGTDKIPTPDVINVPFPAPANSEVTQGTRINIRDSRKKEGKFSPGGHLAALEASSSLRNFTAPTLTYDDDDDDDDDGKLYHVCSSKKFKFSNDKNCSVSLEIEISRKSGIDAQNARTSINEKVVDLNKNSTCPFLLDSVLSIDHVRELIFSRLDRKTLCECRFISFDWAIIGAKSLQKSSITRLDVDRWGLKESARHRKDYSFENLISILNNSTEFPSSTFSLEFLDKVYRLSNAQPLLNAIGGSSIKILQFCGRVSLHELKLFISTETPNLELLSFSQFPSQFLDTRHMEYRSPEERVKTRRCSLDENFVSSPQHKKFLLQNLKVFRCEKHIPLAFVQDILELSPNLAELRLPSKYLPLLQPPVNSPHLFNKLKFSNIDGWYPEIEIRGLIKPHRYRLDSLHILISL